MSETVNLIVILGPTASGKTRLAVRLAQLTNAEIISADSRQVFKGMDIGTGKDKAEYAPATGPAVPVHLIDILPAGAGYDVSQFTADFFTAYDEIRQRGRRVILCGGTGMYIHAVLQNYRDTAIPINEPLRKELEQASLPELVEMLAKYPEQLRLHADVSTKKRVIRAIEKAAYLQLNPAPAVYRPVLHPLVIGLTLAREARWKRIEERLDQRLAAGLIDEAEALLAGGVTSGQLKYYGLEYKFLALYLEGSISRADLREQLNFAIRRFSKRQMTFFRKMEKDGVTIHWLDALAADNEKLCKLSELLNRSGIPLDTTGL